MEDEARIAEEHIGNKGKLKLELKEMKSEC